MSIDWPRFVSLIRDARRFVLTSHIRPDCDALGSELGMGLILESLGKSVRIVNGQATPPNLAFIDPRKTIETIGVSVQPGQLFDADIHMILDTSAWAQLGPMADVLRATPAKKILLDHHVGEDDLGAEAFKNTRAEATGRLVVEAAEALGVKLTADMAMPLFAALATDTGWFRFGSTTPETYHCAEKLVAAGASPSQIYNQIYEQDTLARVKLRGRILARTEADCGGQLVHTYVRRSDFAETGAHASDTEDVVNSTLTIAGTQAAVILVELPGGAFKVSFRSRTPRVNCNAIAKSFSGGGHNAAAGATIEGSFEAVQKRVLDAVRDALDCGAVE